MQDQCSMDSSHASRNSPTFSTASKGLTTHQKWPAAFQGRYWALGMRDARDSPFGGGTTLSSSPCTTKVGAWICSKALRELKRERAANCPASPSSLRVVSRNRSSIWERRREPPGRDVQFSGRLKSKNVSAKWRCAAVSESFQDWQAAINSAGGGTASRPPWVVQPRTSPETRWGSSMARFCATMPPMEIPSTWARDQSAASRTLSASRTRSATW
mmetsp:Transcript_33351/g.96663  ORF Transcript_33351/g.96663 Transcript_33351/m.96663 type:complete len:215 (-) Transcript_33351:276-920(-)